MTLSELKQQVRALNIKRQNEEVIDLLPDSILTQYNDAQLYYESAMARAANREQERAIRDYTRAMNLDPDNSMYYCDRGAAFMFQNEYEKAIKDFSKALELNPDDAFVYFNRGEAWKALEQPEKSLADYNMGIRIKPDFDMCYVGRGYYMHVIKQYDKALEDFNKVVKMNPLNAFVWQWRGKTWFEKKQYNKAVDDFTRAISLDRNNANAYMDRAETFFEIKQYEKALKDYNTIIELDPHNKTAYAGRGDAWYEKKQYQKAVEDYTRLIDLDPYDIYGYNSRAFSWLGLKEYEKAVEDFDITIGLAPDDPHERFNKAMAKDDKLEDKGGTKEEYEDAIRDYVEAIRLDPDYAAAYCNRGVLWCSIEEFDKAIRDLETALRLDPSDDIARRWLASAKSKREKSPGKQNEEEVQDVREQVAAFIDKIRKALSDKFKQSKEGYLHGWFVEVLDEANKRPLVAGIVGWLPEIMPDIAKWQEFTFPKGKKGLEVITHDNETFWPALVGIPMKKDFWRALVNQRMQYLIGEKDFHHMKNFATVNLMLERTVARVRAGKLDHMLVLGDYRDPTDMETFNAILTRMLNTPPQPRK